MTDHRAEMKAEISHAIHQAVNKIFDHHSNRAIDEYKEISARKEQEYKAAFGVEVSEGKHDDWLRGIKATSLREKQGIWEARDAARTLSTLLTSDAPDMKAIEAALATVAGWSE